MSYGGDSGADFDFDSVREREYPTLIQFTAFLENRVGRLLEVIRCFQNTSARIVALNIHDSSECCLVRFVTTHPDEGREILQSLGLSLIESELIGIMLPQANQPLIQVCEALLQAEINLIQTYPLLVTDGGNMAVALMVDNIELAQQTLACEDITMFGEHDLLDMI